MTDTDRQPSRWKILWYMIRYPRAFFCEMLKIPSDDDALITHELLAKVKARRGGLFSEDKP